MATLDTARGAERLEKNLDFSRGAGRKGVASEGNSQYGEEDSESNGRASDKVMIFMINLYCCRVLY